jgi:hypothetical protein
LGPTTLLLLGFMVGIGTTILVRFISVGGDDRLDRASRERIRERVGELHGDPEPRPVGSMLRRLLWRDTSIVLMVLSAGLLITLAVTDPRPPTGQVLEATANAAPGLAEAAPGATTGTGLGPSPSPSDPAGNPTASPVRSATPPEPAPTATPTRAGRDRLAVLTPCPGQPDCYVYEVRQGDNLASIAKWFGIPYATVLALNPQIGQPDSVRAGDRITLPSPRR